MRHIGIKDVFLPQPPSFGKKKAYEVHGILGTGTFGKVVVSGMPDQVCFGHEMNFGLNFRRMAIDFGFPPLCCFFAITAKWQRATWHVPPEQVALAERGAAADAPVYIPSQNLKHFLSTSAGPSSSTKPKSRSPSPSILGASTEKFAEESGGGESDMKKDVALKIIPKKKVKGNEASVWGEMEVLKGLDHPNIVRCHSGCSFM
jgi:calcium/calmodulin-dependent protein kinase I